MEEIRVNLEEFLDLLKQSMGHTLMVELIGISTKTITVRPLPLVAIYRLAESWILELSELRSLLTEKFAAKKMIFSGIPPVRHLKQISQPLHYVLSLKASVFENALQEFCVSHPNCHYVDINLPVNKQTMAKDGFHPNKIFYSTWAGRIRALL